MTSADDFLQSVKHAIQVKDVHTETIMAWPGVIGVGVRVVNDIPVISVYLLDESATVGLPNEIDGIPVAWRVTGEIRAL